MSDVYIGFMDEEVRPVLEALQKKGWNVLVIERGNIDPNGVLFERPISAYKYGVMWKGWCGVSSEAGSRGELISVPNTLNEDNLGVNRRTWLNVFQQCMYMNMLDVYNKLPSGIMETENGRSIKRKLGLVPSVSMLYMGKAPGRSGGLPTKILIRSPEMGLQPGLIRTQMRGIFKALKSASNATPDDVDAKEANKLNLWSYGAGGAYCNDSTHPAGGPGVIWNTKGSIYIGVERDKSAEKRRPDNGVKLYKGEIAYCSEDAKETLYTTPTFYTVAEARRNIESTFADESTQDGLLKAQINPIYNSVGAAIAPDTLGISITSNSFMGENIKTAARTYGLKGGVNMEDYHLYKLIQSLKVSQTNFTSVQNIEAQYPFINNTKVIRIDADPAEIPQEIVAKVKLGNDKTVTLGHYANILKWGLQGMVFESAPNELNWSGVVEQLAGDVEKYLVPYKTDPKKYVNPFLLEAAQDMFREMGKWIESVPDADAENYQAVVTKNPFNQTTIVGNITQLKTKYRALSGMLKTFCAGTEEVNKNAITDQGCQDFIEELYKFILPSGAIDWQQTKTDTPLAIWARGGWGAKSNETYIVSHMDYSGSNVDRAFYKSTNTTVLANNANTAISTYFA